MGKPGNTWYHWQDSDLILVLHVQPRARRDEIVGPHGDALKVRVTAPPVDGKANEHLRQLFAKWCDVSRQQVVIEHGETNHHKRLRIRQPRSLPHKDIIKVKS